MSHTRCADEVALTVRVWGASGSVPVSGEAYQPTGGNTACVQITTRTGRTIILDAGTGIRALGNSLAWDDLAQPITLALTHFHWDHIQGLPFFSPLYRREAEVHFVSGFPVKRLRDALSGQMQQPYFPVSFDQLLARQSFTQQTDTSQLRAGADICSFALHHPGGCFAYRIRFEGASVVFATDHEFGNSTVDAGLQQFASGADLLILDAQFTPEEASRRVGWGHSSWQQAAAFANAAGVKHLALFHHDPGHTHADLADILRDAKKEFAATSLASEHTSKAIPPLQIGKTSLLV